MPASELLLSLRWRRNMERALRARWLRGGTFYVVSQLDGRIDDADSRISSDAMDIAMRLPWLLQVGASHRTGSEKVPYYMCSLIQPPIQTSK